jgi:hypothetical protein
LNESERETAREDLDRYVLQRDGPNIRGVAGENLDVQFITVETIHQLELKR